MKGFLGLVASATIGAAAIPTTPRLPQTAQPAPKEISLMDSLAGKKIEWTFDDGPMGGVKIEHDFHGDGSVTWRLLDGEHRGASNREKAYAAMKVNEKTWALSYLAASGHTLTVVLNLDDNRMVGFGSDEKAWVPMRGRFQFIP